MLQKSFNSLSFLFFVPLVFIGAFFLLNLTLAVIKSKFTEEHNNRKKYFKGNKIMSQEEIDKRKELERIRINRKIKPAIKNKLFKILARVRKRLEQEEVKSATVLQRRMSLKGALRRDLFDY